ncbi:hypothetical protein LTR36_004759 [Oleoguttula mirabilis]|uniref:Uncharacterized protein n=1 Tax=Oleoguttula mirabilis TaxID=1507867 RepID=A0AAV9JG32_9PEZI|nr:hypothetical protein LTR36_004759 [Oleoguttula mirabilis]
MVCTRGAVGRAQAAAIKQTCTTIDIEPFRFLDLPPELRNRVYTFHLATAANDGKIYDLTSLKEPAIAAVSQLVRQESLPIFFTEAAFELYVGADVDPRPGWTGTIQPYSPIKAKYAGTLTLRPRVLRRIRSSLQEAVILRDVTLKAVDCAVIQHRAYWKRVSSGVRQFHSISALRLRCDIGSGVEVAATVRDYYQYILDPRHADVQAIAEAVAGRAGFIGFTIEDLEEVAKGFRVPEEGTRANGDGK